MKKVEYSSRCRMVPSLSLQGTCLARSMRYHPMYQSNRDMKWAIENGRLIVNPAPEQNGSGYDETSIDLHLDKVEEAQVWNIEAYKAATDASGARGPELHVGRFVWATFSEQYLMDPPKYPTPGALVCRRG